MRRKHRKTRTGCSECRRRKVRCDERKPECAACARNGLKCSLLFLTPLTKPQASQFKSSFIARQYSAPYQLSSPPSQVPGLDLDMTGLELLHHYKTTVYRTIDHTPEIDVWKIELPRLAVEHEFLMHGILSLAALHLSKVIPARSDPLRATAILHEHAALPTFRSAVAKPSSSNIHAVFAFSGSIVPYILGSCSTTDKARLPSPTDTSPHWFLALRGLMPLLMRNFAALASGPFGPLLNRDYFFRNHSDNPDDSALEKIGVLFSGAWYGRTPSTLTTFDELKICDKAFDKLRETWALPFSKPLPHQKQNWWDYKASVYVWPGCVSSDFIDLVMRRCPEALVILAYYCALVKKVDFCWYFEGTADAMLGAIRRELGEEWWPWIRWAVEQLCVRVEGGGRKMISLGL